MLLAINDIDLHPLNREAGNHPIRQDRANALLGRGDKLLGDRPAKYRRLELEALDRRLDFQINAPVLPGAARLFLVRIARFSIAIVIVSR